jgi:DNA-directed RNA polymerase specialized sigma24 family protein
MKTWTALKNTATRMGFDLEAAEDLASQGYIYVLEDRQRGIKPRTYRFVIIDAVRKIYRNGDRSKLLHEYANGKSYDIRTEEMNLAMLDIKKLTCRMWRQDAIVIALGLRGYTVVEISKILGLSEHTCWKRIKRAMSVQ